MSYIPLVIESEFREFTKLGANAVSDSELYAYIKEMQELDFEVWCDNSFYNNAMVSNTTTNPQLFSLVNLYLKPYIILGAYEKLLLWHGININKMGLRVNLSDTDTNISDKTKAELLADVRNRKNIYLNKLTSKLKTDSYTYDGVVYDFADEPCKPNPSNSISIKQIGFKKKYFDKKSKRWL